MKKVLVGVLALGLMAGAANAATLRLSWEGGSTAPRDIAPSGSATIQVWMDLLAGDTLSGVFFEYRTLPAMSVQTTAATAAPTNWSNAVVPTYGIMGQPGVQYQAGAFNPATDSVSGAASILIGTQTVHLMAGSWMPSDNIEIVFDHAADNSSTRTGVVNRTGGFYTIDPRYSSTYSGYYTYGTGAPAITVPKKWAIARNPLVIHVVPEPGSLALIALGGLALIRRR